MFGLDTDGYAIHGNARIDVISRFALLDCCVYHAGMSMRILMWLVLIVGPVLGAIGLPFLIGWPVHFDLGLTIGAIGIWTATTIPLMIAWLRAGEDKAAETGATLIGFAGGNAILLFIFFTASIANECGVVYYHYPFPIFNNWVQDLADRMDPYGCP